MTTEPTKLRDTRIDVIRALALLTIFVNHVPGNPFEPLTHKNFGFSDAAEAFVLISGISAGLAYGCRFRPGMRLAVALKSWRRAGVLYMAQLGTTMATLAIFAFFAIAYGEPELLGKINIGPVIGDSAAALVGIVTLGHQLGYNNILSMYAVVLLMMPLFLWLSTISLRLTLAVSGLIWLAAGLWKIGPPNFPDDGLWFLNPLSWQFLFVIGFAATLHVRRGGRIPSEPWMLGAAGFYALLSLLWVKVPLWGVDISMGLPEVITGFNKTFLSLPRLAHVVAVAYLIAAIPAICNLARRPADSPLSVLGRHALPVFVLGTVLAMLAQAWRMVHGEAIPTDVAIITAGVGAHFALAYYLEWYQRLTSSAEAARKDASSQRLPPTLRPVPAIAPTPPSRVR